MVMRKSGRGSVGRALHSREKYLKDKEYRERRKKFNKNYNEKHKGERNRYFKEWREKLKEDLNKRCKVCDKLLCYNNTSGLCKKHCRRQQ